MSSEKNNDNAPSRSAADLLAHARGGEEPASKIHRLREEMRSVIEREYAISRKFHELATSLEKVIPEEKLRYEAALQALSTTLKLGPQEIAGAVARQQDELAILEKAVGELFVDIGTQITFIKTRMGEPGAESAASPQALASGQKSGVPGSSAPERTESHKTCPMCGERISFDQKENTWKCYSCSYEELTKESAGKEQQGEVPPSPGAPAAVWRKKCPACGGQMNFHAEDKLWMCYTCAYEESEEGEAQARGEAKRGQTKAPGPAPESFAVPLSAMLVDESRKKKNQPAIRKKTCSRCQKKMDWHEMEKTWRCFYCGYKTRY